MNVTTATAAPLSSYTRASRANTEAPPAAEPQDKAEVREGSDFGNAVQMGAGGIGAIALIIPCMYAGVIGGCMALSALATLSAWRALRGH